MSDICQEATGETRSHTRCVARGGAFDVSFTTYTASISHSRTGTTFSRDARVALSFSRVWCSRPCVSFLARIDKAGVCRDFVVWALVPATMGVVRPVVARCQEGRDEQLRTVRDDNRHRLLHERRWIRPGATWCSDRRRK